MSSKSASMSTFCDGVSRSPCGVILAPLLRNIQRLPVVESNHLYIYLTDLETGAHRAANVVLKLIEPVGADGYRSASFYALVHNLKVNLFSKLAMLGLVDVINHQEVRLHGAGDDRRIILMDGYLALDR